MYEDIIRDLLYKNIKDMQTSCKGQYLKEEDITYAELSFSNKKVNTMNSSNVEMIIEVIKCGSCRCEPKKKVILDV